MSRPDRGARFLLELASEDAREARYALTVFTPERELRAEAAIALEGGEIRFTPPDGGEAAPYVKEARALAKTLYNQFRADERGRFKRRLMRWRDVGEL